MSFEGAHFHVATSNCSVRPLPLPGQLSSVPGYRGGRGSICCSLAKDGEGYNKNKAIKMKVEATILASE